MSNKKAPINARIDEAAARALKSEAAARNMSTTDILNEIIREHQATSGPTGAERKIAALEAVIQEQERQVRKHTGRATPRKRRMSLTITHEAAQRLETEAAASGMTKSELIDHAIMSTDRKRRMTIQPAPALSASA